MPETVCARCKGSAIDPEDSTPADFSMSPPEPPVLEPCRDCQFTCPGWPECPSPGSCPGCATSAAPASGEGR
jgi:hypothetical protein